MKVQLFGRLPRPTLRTEGGEGGPQPTVKAAGFCVGGRLCHLSVTQGALPYSRGHWPLAICILRSLQKSVDSSWCFFQPSVSHDVLCIEVK